MQNIVPVIESFFIGVALISAINHSIFAWILAERKLHILFAVIAFAAAGFEAGNFVSYYAESVPEMITAQRWRINSGFVFLAVFPWFAAQFTGIRRPRLLSIFTVLCLIIIVINSLTLLGIRYTELASLSYVELPWGETVAWIYGNPSIWLILGYIVALAIFGFSIYAGILQYRRGDRKTAVPLLVGVTLFIILLTVNFLVELSIIPFLYTVGHSFIAIVVAMSVYLSSQLFHYYQKSTEKEHELLAIINNMDAIVYITDTDGKLRLINRQFKKLFNVTLDQVRGKVCCQLNEAETSDKPNDFVAQALQTGTSIEREESLQLKNSEHIYSTTYTPLWDKNNYIFGVCSVAVDITEQKRKDSREELNKNIIEEEVERQTKGMRNTISELESFCSAISHDLRNPIGSISGFSHLLVDNYGSKMDKQGLEFLKHIESSSAEMSDIISGLFELSTLTNVKLSKETTNISKQAEEIIAELRSLSPERDVTVTIQGNMIVEGNVKLLKIMLTNLISNAWKYTSTTEQASIDIGELVKDGEKVFYVKDNGAGFEMKHKDKLFAPFQRLHTEDKFPGTGIGLSTVRRIINRHQGKIWAEGEVGKGATFSFVI